MKYPKKKYPGIDTNPTNPNDIRFKSHSPVYHGHGSGLAPAADSVKAVPGYARTMKRGGGNYRDFEAFVGTLGVTPEDATNIWARA